MPRQLVLAVVLAAGLAAACGGGSDGPNAGDGAGGSGIATATATLDPNNEKPASAATPAPGEVSVAQEPVQVETVDGIVLKGRLYSPDGPKRQALIIVAAVEQTTWAKSVEAFTSAGIAVLTFDPRGFGETGGEEDPEALAADVSLVTRFVMSREYPRVYVFGVGPEGSEAGVEAAATVETLFGLMTYGFAGEAKAPNHVALGADATWDGEDVLADESLRDAVLQFVLGAN